MTTESAIFNAIRMSENKGYRIEPRYSIDDGRTWKEGGWHTARQTWFARDDEGLRRARNTAQEIVDSLQDSSKMAVIVDEEKEAIPGSDPVIEEFTYQSDCED